MFDSGVRSPSTVIGVSRRLNLRQTMSTCHPSIHLAFSPLLIRLPSAPICLFSCLLCSQIPPTFCCFLSLPFFFSSHSSLQRPTPTRSFLCFSFSLNSALIPQPLHTHFTPSLQLTLTLTLTLHLFHSHSQHSFDSDPTPAMKFGKALETNAEAMPESWRPYLIQYKALKKKINAIVKELDDRGLPSPIIKNLLSQTLSGDMQRLEYSFDVWV
ncbi:MAG: hypothetical protein JOS17DRAFT_31662 [Linnemannia elongata]|nr:MAG: hypothetical protein JOS17DRAFT_31662 [Linnemannia elongata]